MSAYLFVKFCEYVYFNVPTFLSLSLSLFFFLSRSIYVYRIMPHLHHIYSIPLPYLESTPYSSVAISIWSCLTLCFGGVEPGKRHCETCWALWRTHAQWDMAWADPRSKVTKHGKRTYPYISQVGHQTAPIGKQRASQVAKENSWHQDVFRMFRSCLIWRRHTGMTRAILLW